MVELTDDQKIAVAAAQETFSNLKNNNEALNESQLNLLASQLSSYTTDFGEGSYQAAAQSQTNVTGIQDYLQGIKTANQTISWSNEYPFDTIFIIS